MALGKIKSISAFVVCLIPVTLGFIIPVAGLVFLAAGSPPPPDLVSAAAYTLEIGATAVPLILISATTLALLRRWRMIAAWPGQLSRLGYALPGVALALGVLPLLFFIENTVNRLIGSPDPGPLILTASSAGVVIAITLRYLAIGLNGMQTGLGRIPVALEESARVLGTGRLGLLGMVYLPLLARPMGVVGLLVLLEAMKELPVTLLLRPPATETLATLVFSYAGNEQFEEAAYGALVLALLGVAGVAVLAVQSLQTGSITGRLPTPQADNAQ